MSRLLAGIAAAALVAACASNSTSPSGITSDVTIVSGASALTTAAFSPDSFTISLASKDSISWRNADVGTQGGYYGGGTPGVSHHLVSDSTGIFDSGVMAPGAFFIHQFTGAGKFHYHCAIHPGMVGVVVVTS